MLISLIRNNLISIPRGYSELPLNVRMTVITNMMSYGYLPSAECMENLNTLSIDQLKNFWSELESALQIVTGSNRNIGDHVVYKNFPDEVLNMSEGKYWFNQICMYLGLPNELFTTEPVKRDTLMEKVELKVLHLATPARISNLVNSLINLPSKWTNEQYADLLDLHSNEDLSTIPHKENLVRIWATKDIKVKTATDVLRIAAILSGGSLREKFKFKLTNIERRKVMDMLEVCPNLEADVANNQKMFKRLFGCLHPNTYRAERLKNVANKLYNEELHSFNGELEQFLISKSTHKQALELLTKRPGEFMRKFQYVYSRVGRNAAIEFSKILPSLKVVQLVKFKKYLSTINSRKYRLFPPKGQWSKVQNIDNTINIKHNQHLITCINHELNRRLPAVNLDKNTKNIKLQTNDNTLLSYGRGTVFPIPNNVSFIRSASYWQRKEKHNTWFDNGWNFFDHEWSNLDAIAWNRPNFNNNAVFSGDPTNSKTADGKACQLIDLYLDKLNKSGIRYAVWSILCFSKIPFKNAQEVFGALQWGEDARAGQLFEPSRAQISFNITDNSFSKFIAYIDLVERKLVYMDLTLKCNVSSAIQNSSILENFMPKYIEYLDSLPSVYDLFESAPFGNIPVVYDDKNLTIDGEAYVFKPSIDTNKITQLNLSSILNS